MKRNHLQNNIGMTLVELLVAFAISAVVMTGLAYMMVSSLNLYGRTNAGIDAQNEAQTAMNMVLDRVMRAGGILLVEQEKSSISMGDVSCTMLGKFSVSESNISFTGDAIFWQPDLEEMYLMSGTYDLGSFTEESDMPRIALEAMKGKLPADQDERLPYLMAKHIKEFSIRCDETGFIQPSPDPSPLEGTIVKKYFTNPVSLLIDMTVEIDYQNGKATTRQLNDSASVRNRLTEIYVQRTTDAGITKYVRKPN